MIGRSCASALLVAIAVASAAACDEEADGAPPTPAATAGALIDPAAPGPYAVGLTKITLTRPSNADGSARVMETWVWYPAEGEPGDGVRDDAAPSVDGGPFPVVVFSHGSSGEPQYQRFLTEHLASHGFVVAAPRHVGNTTADCLPCDTRNIIASARERPDDVEFVLDEMLRLGSEASHPIGAIVDSERAAIAGHSFGGWTSIFVARDGRFDAVVSLAPGLPETVLVPASEIDVPVLLIGGGRDELVPAGSVRKLYDALPASIAKMYVSLPEGHHLTFVDTCLGCTELLPEARGHELVKRYVTAFLLMHISSDGRFAASMASDPPDALVVE